MRRTGYIILLMIFFFSAVKAQPGRRMERIHAIKVAYLTDKLQLTSEQSARFWPVYNRFEEEKKALVRTYRKDNNIGDAANEDPLRSIDEDIELQQRMLDLRKEYKDEFLKVISPQQLATLTEAEREFKRLLIQQIKERRNSNMNNRKGGWR